MPGMMGTESGRHLALRRDVPILGPVPVDQTELGAPWRRASRAASHAWFRRAALLSIGFHILLAVALLVTSRPKTHHVIRLSGIPVELVSLASPPPSLRAKPAAPKTAAPVVREEEKRKPAAKKVSPPEKKDGTPVPSKDVGKAHPAPTRQTAARDSLPALRTDIPLAGGALGALEIGAPGPLTQYSYYLQAVRDKISSHWAPPDGLATGGHEIASVVAFRIDRRGNVSASYVEEPSGIRVFDTAGLRAVALANPLPPLPQDYPGDWVGIHLKFVYQE